MEQRDLIKDQIEQLGRVLGKILSDFLGLKSKGRVSQAIELSNEQLKTQLDIDLDEVISLESEQLEEYLVSKKLTAENIEILSDYLSEMGRSQMEMNQQNAKRVLTKAIELLNIADKTSKTICFNRINKRNNIENSLAHL